MIYPMLERFNSLVFEPKMIPSVLSHQLDIAVEKVNLNIDLEIERYQDVAQRAYDKHNGLMKGQKGKGNYLGLGLQYRDPSNPIFDCVPTIGDKGVMEGGVRVTAFNQLNEIGEEFSKLISDFRSLGIELVRGRLLKSRPGQAANQHYDLDYRIHIPITTNPRAKAIFGSHKIHMPLGGIYLHNGYRKHSFENLGSEDRIHLVFVVAGMSFDTGLDLKSPRINEAIEPSDRRAEISPSLSFQGIA